MPTPRRSAGLEHFVDREEPIAVFVRALHEGVSSRFPVLVYHGEGGQGKSTLRKKLVRDYCKVLRNDDWMRIRELPAAEMLEEFRHSEGVPVHVAVVDFRESEVRHGQSGTLRLRRQLGDLDRKSRGRLRFPRFDLTYAHLWNKTQLTKLSRVDNFLPGEAATAAELADAGLALGVPPPISWTPG